jgi:glyoxylase-like metal-dependent hydrolase (beta-lactamase superfamily II)
MRVKATATLITFVGLVTSTHAMAQDLGPQFMKFGEGIYAYVGKNFKSNTGIILTQEGVVLIDSGHEPTDSRAVMEAVKKLTPLPVRFLIDTEPHPDHTTGHFVLSPPATIIASAGAGESMRNRERQTPDRIDKLAATSPEMKAALEGYKFISPQVEYSDRMALMDGRSVRSRRSGDIVT